MLLRHALSLRRHSVYRGAAIVLITESNMSFIQSSHVARLLDIPDIRPLVVVSEDSKGEGRVGVITGQNEKVAYIEAVRFLMQSKRLSWAADDQLISDRPVKLREEMCKQMMAYRRERKDPREVGWTDTKVKIFGKSHGMQDDLFIALQMAIYWGRHQMLYNSAFQEHCTRMGWM